MNNEDKAKAEKLERCGFCGRFFRSDVFVTAEELNGITEKEQNDAPLGYCPDAQGEYWAESESERIITRDMAIDAEDPSLEGQTY